MEALRLLKKRPWGIAGAIILLAVILIAALSPIIAPFGFNEISIDARLQPPGPGGVHLLGTDNVGRDIFSRLLYGTQTYVGTGLVAVGTAAVLGLILGFIATLSGRKTDSILRISVFTLSVITGLIILALLLFTLLRFLPFPMRFLTVMISFGRNIQMESPAIYIDLVLALLFLSSSYYVARKVLLSASGKDKLKVLLRELVTLLPVNLGVATGMAALLLFLMGYRGLGVPPPFPEWGGMISGAGRQFLFSAPWMWQAPVTAIIVTVLGLILFSLSVREVWLPRLSKINSEAGT